MPRKAPTPCRYPGCAAVLGTPGYCDRHRVAAHRDYGRARRGFDAEIGFYQSAQWRAVRAAFLPTSRSHRSLPCVGNLSVGIFFACSPSENRNDVASVHSTAARFPARFPQISLSVISRDASARDATSCIFNDLQAAGSISNLVGRWGIERGNNGRD